MDLLKPKSSLSERDAKDWVGECLRYMLRYRCKWTRLDEYWMWPDPVVEKEEDINDDEEKKGGRVNLAR